MKHDSDSQRLSRIPRLLMRPLAVRRYVIPGHGSVEARLWRLARGSDDCATRTPETVGYAVELWGLGSHRFCLVEGDEAHARRVFRLLVRNTVTPCGLRDVLEEL